MPAGGQRPNAVSYVARYDAVAQDDVSSDSRCELAVDHKAVHIVFHLHAVEHDVGGAMGGRYDIYPAICAAVGPLVEDDRIGHEELRVAARHKNCYRAVLPSP